MRKQYTIKTLGRIKQLQEKSRKAQEAGIDLLEFLDPIWGPLEESIAILFSKDEETFEIILGWVQWWLYEDVKKRLWINGKEKDVARLEDFVEFLELEYQGES